MAEQPERRGRGRPPSANPKDIQLNVRINAELRAALEAYRVRHDLDAQSDAARDILKKTLRKEGLLPAPRKQPEPKATGRPKGAP